MRIVQECKFDYRETLPSKRADGCVKLAENDGERRGGWHVAVFGTPQASGTRGMCIPPTSLPPSSLTTTPPPSLYIQFIAPPSVYEDNGTVKF